jgi:antitoxin CptB
LPGHDDDNGRGRLYIKRAPGFSRVFAVGDLALSELSSEGLDPRRRRLLFRSRHRGIREMDLVLGPFADARLAAMSETELDEFERWLDVPDQQIFAWINGTETAPVGADTALFRALIAFHRGGEK